jgi:phosphoglycolate phosphatase-like HAD superfamily hydrolase
MFRLCLFDLDNTLVSTDDLEELRLASKKPTEVLLRQITRALEADEDRVIYSRELLEKIRADFPELMLGVFTRAPRRYAETVLEWAYPDFEWDILVSYDDAKRTKPYGDGIDHAMAEFELEYLNEVIVVGDNDVDIRSAYHCGCLVALDKSDWPGRLKTEHWRALERMPDAIITKPELLVDVLNSHERFLPELERLLVEGDKPFDIGYRFDKIGHFIPRDVGGDTTSYPIYACGRSFANYKSLKFRQKWHELTESIGENKEADSFPEAWIVAVRHFIESELEVLSLFKKAKVIITVIPHRPGRKPRLETLLAELDAHFKDDPIKRISVTTAPGLLAYKEGVKSNHGEHLGAKERFENVRDHLFVAQPKTIVADAIYIVIDDVVTTGASLIYAAKYLKDSGANQVKRLAFAKNVSEILPKE